MHTVFAFLGIMKQLLDDRIMALAAGLVKRGFAMLKRKGLRVILRGKNDADSLSFSSFTSSSRTGSASWARRSLSTAIDPLSEAMWSGVRPSAILRLVSAPDFSNIFVHFSPRASSILAEICSGVSPITPPSKNATMLFWRGPENKYWKLIKIHKFRDRFSLILLSWCRFYIASRC